jgi:uncharacterized peroxidase-related enzyme
MIRNRWASGRRCSTASCTTAAASPGRSVNWASVVNRCVYCASVHAARYIHLTKQPAVIAQVFAGDAAGLSAREQAIIGFSARLSACPPAATPADVRALHDAGMDDAEIFDLVLSVAVFGWANRLMHTLGEPVRPAA